MAVMAACCLAATLRVPPAAAVRGTGRLRLTSSSPCSAWHELLGACRWCSSWDWECLCTGMGATRAAWRVADGVAVGTPLLLMGDGPATSMMWHPAPIHFGRLNRAPAGATHREIKGVAVATCVEGFACALGFISLPLLQVTTSWLWHMRRSSAERALPQPVQRLASQRLRFATQSLPSRVALARTQGRRRKVSSKCTRTDLFNFFQSPPHPRPSSPPSHPHSKACPRLGQHAGTHSRRFTSLLTGRVQMKLGSAGRLSPGSGPGANA